MKLPGERTVGPALKDGELESRAVGEDQKVKAFTADGVPATRAREQTQASEVIRGQSGSPCFTPW